MPQEMSAETKRFLHRIGNTLAHVGRTIALVIEQIDTVAGEVEPADLFVPPAGIDASIAHNFAKRHIVNPSVPVVDTESLHTIDREVS